MSKSDLVRFSRDGDQFHYRWAARRCLRLLGSRTDLAAVTIEGVSVREAGSGSAISDGEETVDVAEYYGSQTFKSAHRVDYVQLKHSTARTSKPWTVSELSKTLEGFAGRYQALRKKYGAADVDSRLTFRVTSNRPFSKNLLESVDDLGSKAVPRHSQVAAELQRRTKLPAALVGKFFERLELDGSEADFRGQADRLGVEANALLAGTDLDVALRLKELVTSKATSEGRADNAIVAGDVLYALRASPEDLFPAPSRLEPDPGAIPRRQEAEIGAAIVTATMPVLVSATGGVGKSVLATRLGTLMPSGSTTIVYDCFGNGEYRQLAHARHPHSVALVQIANELAALGLCEPLLPSSGADPREYMRAFVGRLGEAAIALRTGSPSSLITIIVDAADNAQMAADEASGSHAFVRDLVRQNLPDGVRLAMLYRPEREYLLQPPPNVLRISLEPFTLAESAAHLQRSYPAATAAEALEFHRLSSANPRVQANAIAIQPNLAALLKSLGPSPTTVDTQIAEQLRTALAQVKDDAVGTAADIDVLCAALAVLRPLVPVKILAQMSGLTAGAIHSFVSDFGGGRPLLIAGESVQFRDEPVEDWFRKTYRADHAQLQTFVDRLKPLADRDAYVAACLPSLMLACGQLAELVEMALSRARLPTDSPLARRQIEVERLQFAFRASLRAHRWTDAAKLSMKAAEEAAGAERHDGLFSNNPDLIARTFDVERLQDLVARQVFASGGWLGRRYVKEAVLLSSVTELRGEALSKLRMAESWLSAWARLPSDQRSEQNIDNDDRANLALAHLNLRGADAACAGLMLWAPDRLWYESGRILARTLVDHGRFADLNDLAAAATTRQAAPLIGAIAAELAEVNRSLSVESAKALLSAKVPRARRLWAFEPPWLTKPSRSALTYAAVAALQGGDVDRRALARRLTRLLPKQPPRWIASRTDNQRQQYLRAASLRAALLGEDLLLEAVAPEEIRKHLQVRPHSESREVREFKGRIGALLPWWKLWAKAKVSRITGAPFDLASEIAAARKAVEPSIHDFSDDRADYQDEVAEIWFDLLCEAGPEGVSLTADFELWVAKLKQPLYVPTLAAIARKAARSLHLQGKAHAYAERTAVNEWNHAAEDVDSRIDTLVSAARAIFSFDTAEAGAFLSSAVEVATRLGDDVYDRWAGVLAFAERAAVPGSEQPELAYRLSRTAELCAEYVDRHFDWSDTVTCVAGLAPSSAVAIISRWRDREVGWFNELFVDLADALAKLDRLDPVLACGLVGFRFGWKTKELLERALGATSDAALRQTVFDLVVRYDSLDSGDAERWRDFVDIGSRYGLDTGEADLALGRARPRVQASKQRIKLASRKKIDWQRKLARWPVETAGGALKARQALRAAKGPFSSQGFWSAVFQRVPPADAPAFIEAVLNTRNLDTYDLREFLQSIPPDLRQRRAIDQALKQAMKTTARRLCWSLHMPRHDAGFSIHQAATLAGCSDQEIVEQVLAGVADDIEPAGSANLFRLAPLLATLLGPSDAQSALDHALSLIEASLEEGAGDGTWSVALAPGPSIDEAMGGLVWAALGALQDEIRWQAAHTVRAFARLGRRNVLAAMVRLAENGAGPFASPNLPFYDLHARQWFVVALARSARESPGVVADYAAFLRRLARRDNPHVMIRYYAADALLALDRAGAINIAPSERERLETLNTSKLAPRALGYGEGPHFDKYASRDGGRDYLFDYDSKDFMEGVARAFLITMPDLERIAERVIRTDWALDADGHWNREPRRSQRTLAHRERGRGSPASSYNAYLTYHATMVAAGQLLETHAPRKYSDERSDEFVSWFGYRTLTRSDGLWIFDRRDPVPCLPPRLPEAPDDIWRWSISTADFDRALGRDAAQLVIWGDWTEVTAAGSEHFSVHSTLVDPKASRAYLAGAQTADHPWDFYPQSEGREEESKPPFVTRTWVRNDTAEPHLDRHDPWAAFMRYPPPTPAGEIRTQLGLQSTRDGRRWIRSGRKTPFFISEGWATSVSDGDEGARVEGDRLMISRRSLQAVLKKLRMDVIIEVEIRRDLSRWKKERDAKDYEEHPLPYFRFYLVHHDGTIETLS
ncbi:hypothetical protein CA606_12190 [Caulobacter vibrioides]|uniref:ATP-binding protein n=1 Tax=Caulobacter vibrioides TaxID=155892 RepID=A0A290MZG9_CAUVI|nr:hypothetical protein [Caulobacter vibrioides]ATC33024.1 hypothetical protein CA606_12190 [Caulobacter vibrioides]